MTDRELMQQALEALEDACGRRCNAENNPCWQREIADALRERLAQPEQETVMAEYKLQTYAAYKTPDGEMKIGVVPDDAPLTLNGVPLYPRREWVGLTLEEIGLLTTGDGWAHLETPALALFARAIEAKLKEKNA